MVTRRWGLGNWGVVKCFLIISLRLCILWQDCPKNHLLFSLQLCWGYAMIIYLVTHNVNLNHLIKIVSSRFSTIKLLFPPFVINKCIGKIFWDSTNNPSLLLPTSFSIHQWVMPVTIIIWCSFLSFLSSFLPLPFISLFPLLLFLR